MLTVPEAARRVGRNPETVRRWIRQGRLPAQRIGTQHLIDEDDLSALGGGASLPVPPEWAQTLTGEPMPHWAELVRRSRSTR